MIMTYKECIEKYGNAYQVSKVMEAGFVYKIEEGIYSDNEFESEAAIILKKYPKAVLTGEYAFYLLQNGLVGSPCSPRDSQESSPTPQFNSINSLALSLLHSPTLTSIHDHWKNHSLD